VDGTANVYVTGHNTDNAFKITPGGVITEIIDATGDGAGNILDGSWAIAADGAGNVYVTGDNSSNAFKITPAQVPLQPWGLMVTAALLRGAAIRALYRRSKGE
jgi:hypothetical protein